MRCTAGSKLTATRVKATDDMRVLPMTSVVTQQRVENLQFDPQLRKFLRDGGANQGAANEGAGGAHRRGRGN